MIYAICLLPKTEILATEVTSPALFDTTHLNWLDSVNLLV